MFFKVKLSQTHLAASLNSDEAHEVKSVQAVDDGRAHARRVAEDARVVGAPAQRTQLVLAPREALVAVPSVQSHLVEYTVF